MATFKSIKMSSVDPKAPVLTIKNADMRTSGLMLRVIRTVGGVDLGRCGWSIRIKSGDESDVQIINPIVSDNLISFDWVFPQIVAAHVGVTEFQLCAVDADENQVWQSGIYQIDVTKTMESNADYDPEKLSIFERTVSEVGVKVRDMGDKVDGYEARIADAVDAANTAAEKADKAVTSVERVVDAAERAAESAEESVKKADEAVTKAGTAANKADTAASNADKSAKRADDAADEIERRANAGYFDGRPGDKGDPGEVTYIENPYDDSELSRKVESATQEVGRITGEIPDLKNDLAQKVGYSEVVGNQLLMYADPTKSKLLATMDLPTSTPTDVQVNGESIVVDGVANIPRANGDSLGLSRYHSIAGGIEVDYNNNSLAKIKRAEIWDIDAKTQAYRPIVPVNLDYAIRAGLCSNAQITDADKPLICETIGAEPKKGDWVLKGTITKNAPTLMVDLSGCSELHVSGVGTVTGNVTIAAFANGSQFNIFYYALTTTSFGFSARYIDSPVGFDSIVARNGNGEYPANNQMSVCCINGNHIENITKILVFPSNVANITECNIKIYAR